MRRRQPAQPATATAPFLPPHYSSTAHLAPCKYGGSDGHGKAGSASLGHRSGFTQWLVPSSFGMAPPWFDSHRAKIVYVFFIVFLKNDQILRIDMDKKNVKTRDRRSSETEAEDSPSSLEQKKNKCCAILHRGSVFPQVYLPKRAARPWHYTTLCLLCRAVSSHRATLSAQARHYGSLTVPCR